MFLPAVTGFDLAFSNVCDARFSYPAIAQAQQMRYRSHIIEWRCRSYIRSSHLEELLVRSRNSLDDSTSYYQRRPLRIPCGSPNLLQFSVAKTVEKITIEKEKLRLRERAPILPSKRFEDKRTKTTRRAKNKKDLRRQPDADQD